MSSFENPPFRGDAGQLWRVATGLFRRLVTLTFPSASLFVYDTKACFHQETSESSEIPQNPHSGKDHMKKTQIVSH